MAQLSEYMLRQFETRMAAHLRAAFPAATQAMPDPELRAAIRTGMAEAAAYDVVVEEDIQRYLGYMMIYGRDFDRRADTSWAGDILRIENLDGSLKMDRIDEHDRRVQGHRS